MTYAHSMAAGRQRYGTRSKNAVSFQRSERALGPVSNAVLLIVLACLLGLLYLTQVTKTNAYGYKINDLQQRAQTLKSDHDALQIESARLQSLDRVQNSSVAQQLVSVAPSGTVR
jgi:hypothetical protein